MTKLKDRLIIAASVIVVTGIAIVGQAHAGNPHYPGKHHNDNLTIDQMIDTSQMDARDLKERQDAQERLILNMVKKGK